MKGHKEVKKKKIIWSDLRLWGFSPLWMSPNKVKTFGLSSNGKQISFQKDKNHIKYILEIDVIVY